MINDPIEMALRSIQAFQNSDQMNANKFVAISERDETTDRDDSST